MYVSVSARLYLSQSKWGRETTEIGDRHWWRNSKKLVVAVGLKMRELHRGSKKWPFRPLDPIDILYRAPTSKLLTGLHGLPLLGTLSRHRLLSPLPRERGFLLLTLGLLRGAADAEIKVPVCREDRAVNDSLFDWLSVASTKTIGLLGTGAQDGHLDFHTAPELCLPLK